MRTFPIALLFAALLFNLPAQSTSLETTSIQLYTDQWAPYINAEGEPAGRAAKLLELIAQEQSASLAWRYVPYELSYALITRASSGDDALLGFPYFKTPVREQQVWYSKPLLKATNRIYFNRQFNSDESIKDISRLRIARVSGYSYGVKLDKHVKNAQIFRSEIAALNALFANKIDLLPMSETVMHEILRKHFPMRQELVKALQNYSDTSTLHIIASRNAAGRKSLDAIDKSLAHLKKLNISSFNDTSLAQPLPVDIAKLIAAEGYPAILGQTDLEASKAKYYTLPLGTQVAVTSWSKRLLDPSSSDRFYKTMVSLSKVVVLNGPHAGKELFIRNMHLELL